MKSFRQILGEVAQPKSAEEKAFKDLHTYETMPHPVALDHQFTGAIGADDLPREKAKRLADQEGDANYDTSYDDAFEYEGPSFDESVELDEAPRRKGAPKIKPDFLKVQRAKDAEHNAAMGRTRTGRKKPVRTMTSTKKSLASMRRECAGEVELDEGFSPKQIEQLKKAYASMPDRVPMDMAQKMGAILKNRSKEELIAIARADIKWLSTTAATNLIIQGVKASEITGK